MTEKSLLEQLMEYGASDFYPFHMPGHKRREIPDSFFFPDPYTIDITEIHGFDNLHHAEGILKESMDRAAKIYGAKKTYYLVNGSTCGILSAVCAFAEQGGKILMARNCHKSAYHGLILNRLSPRYVYPDFLASYGINGGIRPESIEAILKSEEIRAVFLVSPTYEGIVSDIGRISEIAHSYGACLIVDEAHGAHLPFGDLSGKFPKSALTCGADVVIQSLHKTLPSLTQTAVMHIQGNLVNQKKLEQYLSIFQSSSPSYIFMAAMERCIQYMAQDGRKEMAHYGERMESFFEKTRELRFLKVMDRKVCGRKSVYDWDMSKIVVSTMGITSLNGEILGDILRQKYHLEMEMCAPDYVVAMTSLMDTKEGLDRLAAALLEIDRGIQACNGVRHPGQETKEDSASLCPKAAVKLSLAEALESGEEKVPLSKAQGRISKEFVYLYPPGIPILAPGEEITGEIIGKMKEYRDMGLPVQGLEDPSLSTILTVAKGHKIML